MFDVVIFVKRKEENLVNEDVNIIYKSLENEKTIDIRTYMVCSDSKNDLIKVGLMVHSEDEEDVQEKAKYLIRKIDYEVLKFSSIVKKPKYN